MANDFTARIIAELDTSKIPSQLQKAAKENPIVLKNYRLDTSGLPSQIQGSLDKHKFTIHLDGIKMADIDSQARQAGVKVSNSLVNSIRTQLSNGGVESAIAKVTSQFEKLGTSGHEKLGIIKSDIATLNRLQTEMNATTDPTRLVSGYKEYCDVLARVKNNLTTVSAQSKTVVDSIQTQLNSGGIDTAIARVTAQYERLGSTGHQNLSVINTDIQRLNELHSLMSNASATGNTEQLVTSYKEYCDVLARVKNNLTTVSAQSKTFVSSLQISTLDNKIESWMNKNSRATKDFGNTIQGLRNRLAELNSSGKATRAELDRIEDEFKQIKIQAEQAGVTGAGLGSTLKNAFQSILKYVSVSTVIYQAINAFKQMYQNVVQINSAMTELKKVTDETAESYSNFLSKAGSTARQIGTTMTDYINSTADFARLGYNLADAQELAKVASIYSVVGDDIESIDTATQSIISTMTAFGVKTNETMSIVDKFNEVGNNFAISSGNIGEALQRSASSLAAANNTLDQSIALITAAQTIVQDADAVGTSFKTISARIRGAKTELEELGEEVTSVSKLREEILALSGVDIMADSDTFKSTYDILDELSVKWKDLSDIQRASLTELLGGKRQANVISAIMNNFDIARDALETSLDSEGSAMEEHAKWMESLEAKINILKAAWEELSEAFLDDKFLGKLIDTGTSLLNLLTKIVDTIGSLPTLALAVGAALSFKNIGRTKMFVL